MNGFGPMGGGGGFPMGGGFQNSPPQAGGFGPAPSAGSGKGGGKPPSQNQVLFGTVKRIDAKGWGHIECAATHKTLGKDIFVMQTSIQDSGASVGQMVAFNVAQGAKGEHAAILR